MMNCKDVQELFGLYWDLPDRDLRRTAVDEHIKRCAACAEEFKLWEESTELIKHVHTDELIPVARQSISATVMDRIYADESWRLPVVERAYSLTRQMKMRISAIICVCLALFIGSFLYSFLSEDNEVEIYQFRPGIIPVMSAQSSDSAVQLALFTEQIPTASLTTPFVLDFGSMDSYPNYLIIISILGVIFSLLIMNWLSRLRS
jgi:anti-sigma factor RsiW